MKSQRKIQRKIQLKSQRKIQLKSQRKIKAENKRKEAELEAENKRKADADAQAKTEAENKKKVDEENKRKAELKNGMQVPQDKIDSDFDNLQKFGITFYSDINLKKQTTLENRHKTGKPGQDSYHTPDLGTPIYADKSEFQKYLQSVEDKKKDKKKKDDEVKQKKDDEVKKLFNNLPKSDKDLINEFEKQINSNDTKKLKTPPELVKIVSEIVENNNNTKALNYLLETNENFKKAYNDNTKGKKAFKQVTDRIQNMCMQLVMLYHH